MPEDTTAAARSFATFFATLGDGDANSEASEEMHELAQALQDESLKRNAPVKGTLTIKLDVSCDPRGVVGVSWDLTRKNPKPQRVAAALWVDKKGNFVHENPRQQALFPREVKYPVAEAPRDAVDVRSNPREV